MAWAPATFLAAQGVLGASTQSKAAAQQNVAQNRAIQQYNTNLMLQGIKQINQLEAQVTANKQGIQNALFNMNQQGLGAKSAVSVQAAATGTVGASIKDAVNTVNTQQSLQAGILDTQMQQMLAISNQQLDTITSQTSMSLRNPVQDQSRDIFNSALWGAAGRSLGTYFALNWNPVNRGQAAPITEATIKMIGS